MAELEDMSKPNFCSFQYDHDITDIIVIRNVLFESNCRLQKPLFWIEL